MDDYNPLLTTISLAEWQSMKAAYQVLRNALRDVEDRAGSAAEARDIAVLALERTPVTLGGLLVAWSDVRR